MFDDCPRGMVLFRKPTSKSHALRFLAPCRGKRRARTMMTINTKLQLAILTIQTRIQSGQIRNGFQILLRRFIIVFETAFDPFGTWAAQIMVVAEFVVGGAAFDFFQYFFVGVYGRIETAW